jgi:hypothetical protein
MHRMAWPVAELGKGWPHMLQHLGQKLVLAVEVQEEGAA